MESKFPLRNYLLKDGKKFAPAYIITVVLVMGMVVTQIGIAEITRQLINAIEARSNELLVAAIILTLVIQGLNILIVFFRSALGKWLDERFTMFLQTKLFAKYQNMGLIDRSRFMSGDTVARFTQNIPWGVGSFNRVVVDLTYSVIMIILLLVYMFMLQWQLSLIIAGFYLPLPFLTWFFTGKIRKANNEAVEANRKINENLMEILNNGLTIRSYNLHTAINKELYGKETAGFRANVKNTILNTSLGNLSQVILRAGEFIVIYGIGGWWAIHRGLDLGTIFALMNIYLFMLMPLQLLATITGGIQGAREQSRMAYELLTLPDNHAHRTTAQRIEPGSLILENVTFGYNSTPVLENISLAIHPGEKVLITGPNGSGKSTLLLLILGLVRPSSGRILYRGELLEDINQKDWLRTIASISQNSGLIYGSLNDNITMGDPDVKADEISSIYSLVRLDDIIRRFPEHPDDAQSLLRMKLSTGEKQRIAIGRAMYRLRHANILTGDEIFENIDKNNYRLILESIVPLWKEKTVILVSHEHIDFPFDKHISISSRAVTVAEGEA